MTDEKRILELVARILRKAANEPTRLEDAPAGTPAALLAHRAADLLDREVARSASGVGSGALVKTHEPTCSIFLVSPFTACNCGAAPAPADTTNSVEQTHEGWCRKTDICLNRERCDAEKKCLRADLTSAPLDKITHRVITVCADKQVTACRFWRCQQLNRCEKLPETPGPSRPVSEPAISAESDEALGKRLDFLLAPPTPPDAAQGKAQPDDHCSLWPSCGCSMKCKCLPFAAPPVQGEGKAMDIAGEHCGLCGQIIELGQPVQILPSAQFCHPACAALVIKSSSALPEGRDGADVLKHCGDDASKWAAEFRATAIKLGYSDMDEGWLIGWFANAIEHSGDVRRWRKETASPTPAVPESGLRECPFCGEHLLKREYSAFHPDNDCWLATAGEFRGGHEIGEFDYAAWNTRPSRGEADDFREQAEQYCLIPSSVTADHPKGAVNAGRYEDYMAGVKAALTRQSTGGAGK